MIGDAKAVEQRIRRASELSGKIRYDTPRVDMSPGAVDRRLREAADLSQVCAELRRAGARSEKARDPASP